MEEYLKRVNEKEKRGINKRKKKHERQKEKNIFLNQDGARSVKIYKYIQIQEQVKKGREAEK